MLFDASEIAALLFCRQTSGEVLAATDAPLSIVLVSSGNILCQWGTEAPRPLCAGGLCLAPGCVQILPEGPCHAIVLGAEGIAAQRIASGLEGPLFSDSTVCPHAPEQIHTLLDAASAAAPDRRRTSLACYELLCALACADQSVPALPPLIAEALAAMRAHYAELYGVEELSAQLGVSKSHFVRLFSASMGISPGQYLTRVRISAAKQMLLHREYTLEIIASLCGFSGANYLCKVFKKETGETPAAYRAHNAFSASPDVLASERESALYI